MAARLVEIEDVYRSRYGAFLRVATAIVGEEELARDAVQDAVVRAVVHRRRWRADAPLEVWIWRIVVNEARKRRRFEARDLPAAAPPEGVSENGAGEPLRALVTALP